MSISKEIRRIRTEMGLSQKQLAAQIGVTPAAIGNYECGVSFPKEEKLMALFTALHCTPNDLLGEGYVEEDVLAHSADYASLDEQGRRRVDKITEQELARCGIESRFGAHPRLGANSDEREVLIAAREGGDPKKSELTPRPGKSVLDAPDYHGGKR